MPVKPSKRLAMVQRRQKVADLQLQGWTQMAIAAEVGISQALVSNDLARIRQSWRESAIRDFDAARDQELQKLDRIEREAWAAWQRSQQPTQSATLNGEGGNQKARRTVKNQNGDPRFLEIVLRCSEARRKLLGLDAPTMIAPTTPDGQPLTVEDRRIHINAILAEHFGITVVTADDKEQPDDDDSRAIATVAGDDDGRGTGPFEPAFGSSN
jgi:hypothetical protein